MYRCLSAIALSLVVVTSTGCQRSEKEKALEAQREADRKVQEAERESTTRITSAEMEAQKKMAAVEADFAKTREAYRHRTQEDMDDMRHKLEVMDANALKATGKTKADADASLREIHTLFDAYERDHAAIDTATTASWDDTKARLDKEWEALNASVKRAPLGIKLPL